MGIIVGFFILSIAAGALWIIYILVSEIRKGLKTGQTGLQSKSIIDRKQKKSKKTEASSGSDFMHQKDKTENLPPYIHKFTDPGPTLEKIDFTKKLPEFIFSGPYKVKVDIDLAIRLNHSKLFLALLQETPDIQQKDAEGNTLLHKAAASDAYDIIQILLNNNIKQTTNKHGWTPLMTACDTGGIKSVRLLLSAGTNPNSMASKGKSPLTLAAIKNKHDNFKVLLSTGANPKGPANDYSPFYHALQSGRAEILDLLRETSGIPVLDNEKLAHILREQVSRGNDIAVKFIISLGANPNHKNAQGFTAINIAEAMESDRPGRWTGIIKTLKSIPK
jgi:ankyrin repeat protein